MYMDHLPLNSETATPPCQRSGLGSSGGSANGVHQTLSCLLPFHTLRYLGSVPAFPEGYSPGPNTNRA